jgi:hypothetical protein
MTWFLGNHERRRGDFASDKSPLAGSGGLSAASKPIALPNHGARTVAIALAPIEHRSLAFQDCK